MTIVVDAPPEGLEVRLDGAVIEPAHLGKPLPFDGGDHVLIASAPHKQAWSTQLTLAKSADSKTVNVAALQDAAAAAPVAAHRSAPARARAQPEPREARDGGMSAGEWIGLGTIGAGIVGLGVGTYFAVRAGNDHDAGGSCDGAQLHLSTEARLRRLGGAVLRARRLARRDRAGDLPDQPHAVVDRVGCGRASVDGGSHGRRRTPAARSMHGQF